MNDEYSLYYTKKGVAYFLFCLMDLVQSSNFLPNAIHAFQRFFYIDFIIRESNLVTSLFHFLHF